MSDARLTALTETSVPALNDWLYSVDLSDTTDDAAGSSRKLSFNRLLGMLNHVVQGRLTLESGVAVSTSDQTAKTNVYFTPAGGNLISLYDGTRWRLYSFSERTLALGTLTSGKNYDVFCYDNAGTLTLELSAAWTDDTTRADALAMQDGVYVKSGATTRRLVGTIRTTSTTTTEDSAAKRFCGNLYNRVHRHLQRLESASTWTYTTDSWRQANANADNQVEWVSPIPTSAWAIAHSRGSNSGASTTVMSSIGYDSTSTPYSLIERAFTLTTNVSLMIAQADVTASSGRHFLAWLERSGTTSGTTTWTGVTSGTVQTGMSGGVLL